MYTHKLASDVQQGHVIRWLGLEARIVKVEETEQGYRWTLRDPLGISKTEYGSITILKDEIVEVVGV